MRRLCRMLATLGPVGYLPLPGTSATIATLPVVWLLGRAPIGVQVAVACAVVIGAVVLIHCVLPHYRGPDPRELVIDEVAGCLVTFCALPLTSPLVLTGFLLFRFFDITKIFGVGTCERVYGAWGIVLDDVWAGILSNVALHALFYAF